MTKFAPIPDFNTTHSVETIDEDGYDTLTIVDLGDGIVALSQIGEDGTFHNIIVSPNQAEKLAKLIIKVLG